MAFWINGKTRKKEAAQIGVNFAQVDKTNLLGMRAVLRLK